MRKNIWPIMGLLLGSMALTTACSDDNTPAGPTGGNTGGGAGGGAVAGLYPAGSIVWKEDTTVVLRDHFIVPEGKSLYIEKGATVIAANSAVKPEIVVLGNLYSMGTAEKPVTFTVADSLRPDRFSRNWGGIICGFNSEELYLDHTTIEYGGAQTTEQSASFQHQLFKTETGEGVPGVHFCNKDGRMVITNCTFRNNAEDQIYITGGRSIVANNRFISNGFDGGEAINYKSDCLADIAYNLIYDANTNALKLSNNGFVSLQSDLSAYNNTIVNTGWRRPKVKGGSIWLEINVNAKVMNNLIYDCRWGMKHDTEEPEDAASILTPNFYYASTAAGVQQMQPDAEAGILGFATDKKSATAGDNNPLFANFTQQADVNINVGSNDRAAGAPQEWNDAWDFHLQAGSPALSGASTSVPTHFLTEGLTMKGLSGILPDNVFYSPAPSAFFGAYGQR